MVLEWFWFLALSALAAGLAWLQRTIHLEEDTHAALFAEVILFLLFVAVVATAQAVSWDGVLGFAYARLAESLPQPGTRIHELTCNMAILALATAWGAMLHRLAGNAVAIRTRASTAGESIGAAVTVPGRIS